MTLFGKPSAQFAEQLTEEEKKRIEKQRSDLGETKLEELQKKLEDAMAANDIALPNDILENFTIPPVSSINFINVLTARNELNLKAYATWCQLKSVLLTFLTKR